MSPIVSEPIAIIGSSCRFAGDATSPSKLWELLCEPRDVRRPIPEERFSAKGFYHANNAHHGHTNVSHAYMIDEDIAAFDAEFFGIKPVEAKAIDPQQRILMETVYEGMENAGLSLGGLRGSDTSVYVGVMCNDYEALLLRELSEAPTYLATGIGRSILSNRLSYFFDWHGPSITMDTACSSSLVAVHMAVRSLRSGESRCAVACGSNLMLGPENFVVESKLKMLSPDGQSKMWDRDANGYARGDGVAAVIMKTLSQAIADGDSIDCIIRETGLNQDGATTGITMPSSVAQKALILSTYEKAGLNIEDEDDRPQYFEAHGTGTPAGDPIEAEAIAKAFFGDKMEPRLGGDPLYVGSIKTVLGHTEGTAGIAAILKASLALKNCVIPPNLLFNNLSDGVKPFYDNLKISTVAIPWPASKGGLRRASVNSFGFGGANAHAILESYDRPIETSFADRNETLFTPFVFSAVSENSLRRSVSAYSTFIESEQDINVQDLAYTLRHRRSILPYRVSVTASSVEGLRSKMLHLLEDRNSPVGVRASPAAARAAPKILGVFTGQGAQYARMGAELLMKSPKARRIIQDLESYLAPLPDRPTWSLQAELLASAETSRVGEAIISQPLCTAVQIMILDLLREANVNLDAVVGHSSGEIAAAYASGFLTARDAMVIAFYRGLHTRLAASPTGAKGAMLAVGTSLEDAQALCEDDELIGRINVAASNSSSSVTISGDEDAIDALQIILQDENKFNRKLRVDQAYHSRHMLPAFDPYVQSVQAAGVEARKPTEDNNCVWFSSVYNKPVQFETDTDFNFQLSGTYWAQNMTMPVLFSQALESALTSGTEFDMAIEVGPHPALKGPATQTMQEVLGKIIPYASTLDRGASAVAGLATSLGFLWARLDMVDLERYDQAVSGRQKQTHRVLKGLPMYAWNHDVKHWHESRRSRRMRTRQGGFHPLLGDVSPDSAPHCLEWRNILRPSELPWLDGHRVQSQIVFPAAGYASTAFEAAKFLSETKPIRLIELSDLNIRQAVAFSDEEAGVEVIIRVASIEKVSSDRIRAEFKYSADLGSNELTLAATGVIDVLVGEPSPSVLPDRTAIPPHTIAVETGRFYNSLADLGYNFSGRFQSLSGLRRRHGLSTCAIKMASNVTGDEETLLAHPAELDASFQSIILAYAYPYDDQLRVMHLPTSISRITVNPALCGRRESDEHSPVDAWLRPTGVGQGFTGDCTIYSTGSSSAVIRVEGVTLRPLGSMTADSDRKVFSKIHWFPGKPSVDEASADTAVTEEDKQVLRVLERMSTYYLREFDKQVPVDSPARCEAPNSCYLNYAKHMTALVARGENPWVEKAWLQDTLADVYDATNPYEELIPDIKIMHLVGQQMPRVFRGETTMLEEFRESGLLDDYYTKGFGFKQVCKWLSRVLVQICNIHPHMNILEIGAGTGGATKSILPALESKFLNYTFTDVSAGFFENAASIFADYKDQMLFKVLDLEKDPLDQAYAKGSYDVIVGSLVVHATAELEKTMRHLRTLLKPGGFLVIGEGSHNCTTGGFIFGPMAGWWLGVDEGRTLTPFVSGQEWDRILKATGFSGVDTTTPQDQENVYGVTVWVAQAIDDEIQFLREPLSTSPDAHQIDKLAIVGGNTRKSAHLVDGLKSVLKPYAANIHVFKTLADVDYELIDETSTVVSLADLDGGVFENIQPDQWKHLKQMFEIGKTLLWLTSGREADQPYANMMVGFGRTAHLETPGLRLQFLDVPDATTVNARQIAETVLRLQVEVPEDRTDILWTVESELIMDASGRHLVSRLLAMHEPNDRYNSAFRTIQHEVDICQSVVQLQRNSASEYVLGELSHYGSPSENLKTMIELRTTNSLLYAIRTPIGYKYLVIGETRDAKMKYMALVSSLTSILNVPTKEAVPFDLCGSPETTVLALAAAYLTATAICDPLFPGDTLAMHNAPSQLSQAVNSQVSQKGVGVVYTTDSTETPSSAHIQIPPYLSKAEASRLIPEGIRAFVGLSNHRSKNETTIMEALSPYVRKETVETLYSADATPSTAISGEILSDMVKKALKYAQGQISNGQVGSTSPVLPVSLEALVGQTNNRSDLSMVVDWTTSPKQLAQVSRLDSRPMFKGDKTYWMVGLSGALGISLCDWMIDRGARYLVLTSRNPKIAVEWVRDHAARGVKPRLRSVHAIICKTLPPIIGVLNGAMVLRDVSILNMSYEQLVGVTRPKVLGSIYLDRIFDHQPLDFFIFFSSINCVVGNLGQANYAAANMFMCAMAANRRKRGLTASALNVGAIIGAGYMERESSKALDLTVSKMALMHLSEEDFHQLFAEGIEAGLISAKHGPEVSTGLLDVAANAEERPRWCKDPKFWHFINYRTRSGGDNVEQTASVSIADILKSCKEEGELLRIVQGTLAAQLRNVLQMSTSDEDLMTMRSSEIGLDSLISVDVRTWFLKHYHVSIPVLKIMGNDTMANLAKYAAENIPPEIVPQMSAGQDSDTPTSTSRVSTDGLSGSKASSTIESGVLTPDGQSSPATPTEPSAEARGHDSEYTDKIDYEAESTPPADFADLALNENASNAPAAKSQPEVVLLTGVSGLLGHHLLNHLLDNEPQVKKVICIAVRQLSERLATQKLRRHDCVSYFEGDLGSPRLGLSEEDAAAIFDSVDVVIHNGADTSHLKYYPAIKAANVLSTQFLARMCLPRRIPIHYVSSVGVSLYKPGRTSFPEISVTDTSPPSDGSHGYIASKWTIERFLEQVSKLYGLKVWIHRPSTIIREGDDTVGRAAQMDWVNALVEYSHRLQVVPRYEHTRGALDFVYVATAVQDIVRHVVGNRAQKPVTYVHQVGDLVLPVDNMKELAGTGKLPYQEVSIADWAARAMVAGLHPAVASVIETMDAPGTMYPRMLRA
ncbi:putative polyketide synthase [Whalleya microplaca]|nr:putative polyketide synthase [Whalleya microplaca]